VVSIDDVVVPVSLASLKGGALESECALPGTGLCGRLILSKWELSRVVIPRTEKMYGLDSGGGPETETKLNGRHVDLLCI
jgi:hypothetical protein